MAKKQPALPWAELPFGLQYRRCDVLAVENLELTSFITDSNSQPRVGVDLISDRRVFQLGGFDRGIVI